MGLFKKIYEVFFLWNKENLDENIKTINGSHSPLSRKNLKLNPLTLSFPKDLEKSYIDYYNQKSILQINFSIVAGAVFFAAFFFFDFLLVPELFSTFATLRFGVVPSIILVGLLLINKLDDKSFVQPILSFAVILIGILNTSFIIIAFPKLNSYYFIGTILIYFWAYTFLKLRYFWATLSGISIYLFYEFTLLFIIEINTELHIISSSYLIASNIAGMSVAYFLEYYSRKDFFQNLILDQSKQENLNLSEKISESDKVLNEAQSKLILQSLALESAANSIIILNRKGDIIWCNNAFSTLTGYSAEEVLNKNPRILRSNQHSKSFYKNLWDTILKGNVWSGEIINKKKNGDLYYEEMMITPVSTDNSEHITHFIAIKQDISLRKNMEEELQENEKRLRSLFENATMGLYRSKLSGEIVFANDALIKMLGFDSIHELQERDRSNANYVEPNKRTEFIKKIEEHGTIIGFESEWRRKDGSIIYIRESARMDYDQNGEIIYEGTVEDITLSKLAKLELEQSREKLQTVFDNLYDAILLHDKKGNILKVNSKVLDLYNISMEDALGYNFTSISSLDNNFGTLEEQWKTVLETDKTYKFEWKAKRPSDNFVFDVEIFLSKIYLGDEISILANIRDITEEKEAHRKLLITQKAADLNASPIFWLTNDSKVIYVNKAATKMLGYTFEQLIEMKVPDFDTNWSIEYWNNIGYPNFKKKGTEIFERVLKKKTGETLPVEINASIIKFENEEIIVAIVTDITERKTTAQNLIKAKEKAEQSDKLKSDFLAGMSHEIRTPINTILNFISLIRSELGESTTDDIDYSFDMINRGSRRLIRTIDSILNMSQFQSGVYDVILETFSIENVLKEIKDELNETAIQKNIDFSLIINADNHNILGDQYTISQLFINLIDNALKYTEKGKVKVVVEEENSHLVVKVKDTGIGISEEFLPRLFSPFEQEEMGYTRSFEGTGLGLALVKNYVDLNEGEIEVESNKNVGSTFTVKLKRALTN